MRDKHREWSNFVNTEYPHTFDIYHKDIFFLFYYNSVNNSFGNRMRKQAQPQPTYSKLVIRYIFPYETQMRTRMKVMGPQSS